MKKKVTFKQIAAVVGLLLIVGMYVASFVFALTAKPGAEGMFMASLVATVIVPIVLYIFITLDKWAKKNAPEGISYKEMRAYNKRIKNGEDPKKIAKEIEEKYGIEEEEAVTAEDETTDSVEVSEEESDVEE
ncbi:MAG: hypothetical protein IJ427_10235 [Lachnospiraceae bacterium]|nr:hypothetical protein [Lachnospiraceae bacterium]